MLVGSLLDQERSAGREIRVQTRRPPSAPAVQSSGLYAEFGQLFFVFHVPDALRTVRTEEAKKTKQLIAEKIERRLEMFTRFEKAAFGQVRMMRVEQSAFGGQQRLQVFIVPIVSAMQGHKLYEFFGLDVWLLLNCVKKKCSSACSSRFCFYYRYDLFAGPPP